MKRKTKLQHRTGNFPSDTKAQAYLEGAFNCELTPCSTDGGKTFSIYAQVHGYPFFESTVEGLTANQFEQIMEFFQELLYHDRLRRG